MKLKKIGGYKPIRKSVTKRKRPGYAAKPGANLRVAGKLRRFL